MSTYLERIAEVQSDYDQVRKLINLYKKSRLNNGWLETQQNYSNTTLTGLIGDLDSTSIYRENPGTTSAPVTSEFYDIPMLCKAYDKDLRMGYGAPADIGFAKNVKYGWGVTNWVENRISSRYWRSVCYGNDKFVAVAQSTDLFAYSYDGITWNEGTISDTSRVWNSVCYGKDKFVAVVYYSNYFAYSLDGITWTEGTMPNSRQWSSVCYGKDKFVAVAHYSNYVSYSSDGITWNEGTISDTSRVWSSVCYGNDKFVAVVSYSTYFAYSSDGITWTENTISDTSRPWSSVCYGKDKFVAVTSSSNYFAYSLNGITWDESTISSTISSWQSVCYGNGKFVTVAQESNYFAYSSDGITWNEGTISTTSRNWQSVCYGNDKFVAVAFSFYYITSCIPTLGCEPHKPLYQVLSTSYRFDNASYSATTTTGGTVAMTLYNNKLVVSPNRFSSYPAEFAQTIDDVIANPPNHTNWDYLITNNQLFFIGPITDANHLHLFYCFVSMNTSYGGFCLYVTPNFVNWNVHTIIPSSASSTQRTALFGSSDSYYTVSDANAAIMQNALQKYFRVLPNNNYLVMYPLPMYTGTDKTTMAYMYSPWDSNPIAVIKDPYDTTEEYVDKATKGITCYLTENGEVVLYYNSRPETPLSLYGGRVMSTFDGSVLTNYKREIVNVPKVGRHYAVPDMTTKSLEITTDDVAIDCAIGILESKNGSLSEDDIPAAAVTLALGDAAQKLVDNSEFGDDYQKFDSINLYVPRSIENLDNIDMDMTNYIEKVQVDGEDIENGENPLDRMEWIEGTISSTRRNWRSVCYGKDKFVAVVYGSNYFAYSSDGITWNEGTISDTSRYWNSVCYGKDKFVTVAYNTNYFAYSYDGITWTESTISDTSREWFSICYGKDKFVAVSAGSATFAYSLDGVNWTEISVGNYWWRSICYGKDKFVATMQGWSYFFYSYDGITWSECSSISSMPDWRSICYGKDKFVAVGHRDAVAYSYDGITWIESTICGTISRQWNSVCYGNDKFVAVSNNDINSYIYSLDGITWTESAISDTNRYWWSVCYGKDKFVTVASSSNYFAYLLNKYSIVTGTLTSNQNNLYLKYADEYSNIRQRITTVNNSLYEDASKLTNDPGIRNGELMWNESTISDTSRNWVSVCYGKDKFVMLVYNSTAFAYSSDGITWTESTISSTTKLWGAVCYGNNKFVAVTGGGSYSNVVAYSSDGITWTESTISDTKRNWNLVCYGKDKFVAMIQNSNIFAYSLDGITWIESTTISDTTLTWHSVCYGKDKFVAVTGREGHSSNYFAYSLDGIIWNEGTISDTYGRYYSVCYGDDKFVMIGATSVVAYSHDGIIWTENAMPDYRNWRSVCHGNNKFVAVTSYSNIFAYSSDGILWVESTISSESRDWNSVCYGNDKFIVKTGGLGSQDNIFAYTTNFKPLY